MIDSMECYVKIKSILSQNEQLMFQNPVQTELYLVQWIDSLKEIAPFCKDADCALYI
jgi:hypothetical protein